MVGYPAQSANNISHMRPKRSMVNVHFVNDNVFQISEETTPMLVVR